MRLSPLTAFALLTLAAPVAATAQSSRASAKEPEITIPRSMVPPAGKCRIWMPDVPVSQQPAATDCTTALRQKPANGILVFGPAKRDLSPFDVRNPWGPNGSESARRAAAGRAAAGRDSASAAAPEGRAALNGTGKSATTRQIPSTRTMPTAREAKPVQKDPPPPPPKKPEKP